MNRIDKIIKSFKSGTETIVKILPTVKDIGDNFELEPGMLAKVTGISKSEFGGNVTKFLLVVTPELIEYNKSFENNNYLEIYPDQLKEDGFHLDCYDCNIAEGCSPILELKSVSKLFKIYLKSDHKGSYSDYLEKLIDENL